MKRLEPEQIGDVLRQTLRQEGMTERLYEVKAAAVWPQIIGENLAAYCGKPQVLNGLMTVNVRSAALRQELTMTRSILIRMLNETLGRQVISEIRFK